MKLTASGALKTRASARKVSSFGKQWKSGETHYVAYPIFFDEQGLPNLLVGATWGHPVDPKAIGAKAIFWPSHATFKDDEPVTQDLAYQISRIAPLVLKGQYNKELAKIENSSLPAAAKKQAIRDMEKKFEIQEDGRIGKAAAVGKLKYIVTTEVVDIIQKDSGAPDVSKARLVSQDLSDKKIRVIQDLMQNPRYAPEIGDKFFIVQYSFGNSGERKIDGADASITAPENSMRLHERFPDEFKQLKSHFELLPEDSEMIMKRNSSFQKKDEKILLSAFMSFWVFNEEFLSELTDEDDTDRLKKIATIVYKIGVPVKNPIIMEAIEEASKEATTGLTISADPYVNDAAPSIAGLIAEEDIATARRESGENEDLSSELDDLDISSL